MDAEPLQAIVIKNNDKILQKSDAAQHWFQLAEFRKSS